MARYIVERAFVLGFPILADADGAATCERLAAIDRELSVTWLQTLVDEEGQRTFWLYDAPNPESIRKAAARSGLPVGVMTRVTVFDPNFHVRGRTRAGGRA